MFDVHALVAFGTTRFEQGQEQPFGPLLGALQREVLEAVGAFVEGLVPARCEGGIAITPIVRGPASYRGSARRGGDAPAGSQGLKEFGLGFGGPTTIALCAACAVTFPHDSLPLVLMDNMRVGLQAVA